MKKSSWCEKHLKIHRAVCELQNRSSHFNRTALYNFKVKVLFCVFCHTIGMIRNEIRSRGISRQTCLGIPGCFRTPLHKFLINEIPRLLMLGPLYKFQKTKANALWQWGFFWVEIPLLPKENISSFLTLCVFPLLSFFTVVRVTPLYSLLLNTSSCCIKSHVKLFSETHSYYKYAIHSNTQKSKLFCSDQAGITIFRWRSYISWLGVPWLVFKKRE